MKQIWKYQLKMTGESNDFRIPRGAEVLAIREQFGFPCMWLLLDRTATTEIRHFEIFTTGQEIDPARMGILRYCGTFQLDGGSFVGHVFEVLQ